MGKFLGSPTYVDVTSVEQLRALVDEDEFNLLKENLDHSGKEFFDGRYFKPEHSDKFLILMNPNAPIYRSKNTYDMVHTHELEHAKRHAANTLGMRMMNSNNRFISSPGVFWEELAAQKAMMSGRDVSTQDKLINYLYPIEAGIGRLLNRRIKFNALRNSIRGQNNG